MSDDICFSSVVALRQRLTERSISSSEIVDSFLKRIERYNGVSKAFINVTAAPAMAAAQRADEIRAREASSLLGIPFSVKDLIDIAGVATTGGSPAFTDNVAAENAFLVKRMLKAGAISLGKNNLHAFAYGATGENAAHGTAVNAYDHSRLAGGSSSGSAAAVAFGLVPAAFGTDTGGSVRAPAALSGLVGLKPTMGRVSMSGVMPYCWTLDHVGILARRVADAGLLLQTVAGFDPGDENSAKEPVETYVPDLAGNLRGVRVGIPRSFYFEKCDPEILEATRRVISAMEEAGASLVDVDLPPMEDMRTVSLAVQMPEALSYHSRYLEEKAELYEPDFRAGLALGQCLLAEHYLRAKRFITRYRRETNALFDIADVIVTPAAPIIAPPVGQAFIDWGQDREPVGNAITRYTTFFNMTGHPAIVLPSGLHSTGLPMGVQLVGRYFKERSLLSIAALIEAQSPALPPPNLSTS
ncbi:amidase [Aquibaculum arenosum]|uniref:Amidase n=1 Tax=Aquibaculum arenosum TaxID=3032591 RepID=A0ABT5YMQ4_9PROT|nr:amidase [Fodinicurvata sp. CAU 1616]MDF2096123.1 amidase [Fodinicurvata sp. CAU 1616]